MRIVPHVLSHTDRRERIWYDKGKSSQEYQEDQVDGKIAVEDTSSVGIPLLVEQAGDQGVSQQISTLTLHLMKK